MISTTYRERIWIFDLDNTLHDASAHIFPHINSAMTRYIMTELSLEEHAAGELRRNYWERYGATLHGLMRHHQVDPHHFLHHTHQFPALENMVIKNLKLARMLASLSGRKVLYTNAPRAYANQVLNILKISHHFEQVFSIETTRFRPKPSGRGFRHILSKLGASAARCIMVEDSLPALKTAKHLGMKTVWIHPKPKRPGYVDARLSSVLALPKIAAYL